MKEKVDGIIIESIVKALVDSFIENSKEVLKEFESELIYLFGKELKKFVTKQREYYNTTKTVLHGNSPISLDRFYFQLNLKKRTSLYRIIDTSNIKNIFRNRSFITISGNAGSGKSTLMKYLFLNCIDTQFGLPIFFELRYLNDSEFEIEEILKDKIYESEISKSERIIEKLLNAGKFIFFLDGYDEIKVGLRQRNIIRLNEFIKKFNKNKYIITTRPNANLFSLHLFENYVMKPLRGPEIPQFILKQLPKEEELANKIIESINDSDSQYISSFLTNPLLLSLYILTFRKNPSIPEKRHIFYRRVIQTLYSEHDSISKLGYVREKRSGLSQEDFEAVLKRFSILSYFSNKFTFERDYVNEKLSIIEDKLDEINFVNESFIQDLKETSLWIEDFGKISFSHRSIQEYLAALFVKELFLEQKKEAYSKIIRMIETRDRIEAENFLMLSRDMDVEGYTRFLLIPILAELSNHINNGNEGDFIKNILDIFCYHVKVVNDTLVPNAHPYLAIPDFSENNIVINLISLIDKIFLEMSSEPYWHVEFEFLVDKDDNYGQGKGPDKFVNLENNIPDSIKQKFSDSKEFIKLSKAFISFIDKKLTSAKRRLEINQANDIDIIDLL